MINKVLYLNRPFRKAFEKKVRTTYHILDFIKVSLRKRNT